MHRDVRTADLKGHNATSQSRLTKINKNKVFHEKDLTLSEMGDYPNKADSMMQSSQIQDHHSPSFVENRNDNSDKEEFADLDGKSENSADLAARPTG